MLKLMKYEFRKTRTTLLIMLAALVALEIGFLVGDRMKSYRLVGVSLGLLTGLVFAVYVYILISGIVSYNRELNDRTGYLTFMMPVSPMGIVASKLLYTVLAALAVTALFGAAAYYDYSRLFERVDIGADAYRQLDFTFTMFTGSMGGNVSLTRVLLTVGFEIGTVTIGIILALCTAYLAITLSATLLQNRRGFLRHLLSFLLFIGLNWFTSWVSGRVISDTLPESTPMLMRMLGIRAAIEFAFAAVFAGVSALLLDRKVSL